MKEKATVTHHNYYGMTFKDCTFHNPTFQTVSSAHEAGTENPRMTRSEQEMKSVLETLLTSTDEEGKRIFLEQGQWYAVYRVLSKWYGYPKTQPRFCQTMTDMGMNEAAPPCVYESVKKFPAYSELAKTDVSLWHNQLNRAENREKKQIIVADKLMELLGIV